MEDLNDFATLQTAVRSALVSTTRSTSQLASKDLAFHRSLDASIGSSLDRQNARLLGLAERLLAVSTANSETVRPPRLSDLDSIEGNWRAVVDVVDSLLERTDTALDEFTGAVQRLSPGAAAHNAIPNEPIKPSKIASALRSQNLAKPQLLFDHPPDNYESKPFQPLLVTKPHASVPMKLDSATDSHPYQTEIEHYGYPSSMYTRTQPIPSQPFDTTTATFVDTEEAVWEMLEELKQAQEIAVDLEHHDQRSYIGIVSLMQISTRDRDWIVDTLKPWRRKLQCLNEVFADPKIVKVLHGAYMDVVWLQRDLGLYLVGLFDTHYAARALGYAGGSLAFLLKRFVDVDAQKQYQMADWRVRPLPQELVDYARSDTHFLLYIYDCMRNELLEQSDFSAPDHGGDKIREVLEKSRETALKRYETPIYDMELGRGVGWYRMLSKTSVLLSKEQFAVFKAVHKWRDDVAREQDDSTAYVMPNHQIFSIAKIMPTVKTELFQVAQPLTQTVRLRIDELLGIIIQAKDSGSDGPDMMEFLNKVEPQPSWKTSKSTPVLENPRSAPPVSNSHTSSTSLPLRSFFSTFWKDSLGQIPQQERSISTKPPNVSLSIPLPPLGAEIFTTAEEGEPPNGFTTTPPSTSAPQLPTEHPDEEDDIFILKEQARKRPHHEISRDDSMADQIDEIDIGGDYEAQRELALKKERKKLRRDAKRAQKSARQGKDVSASDRDVPFDYSTAPSILEPPTETREEMKERKRKEKNPYAKAMDAPKGLPRVQKERAGRSMTYR